MSVAPWSGSRSRPEPAGHGGDPFFPDRRSRRLVFGVLLLALAVFGWLDVRGRLATQPPSRHMSDFSCYVVAAQALADGADPYAVANPRGWHYLYPPFLALLLVPLRDLPLTGLGLAWFALNVACAAGTYFVAVRLHGGGQRLPAWLAVLPVAAVLASAISSLQRGQVSLVLLFLVTLGLGLALQGSPRWAPAGGAALAAAAAIKLVPALPAAVLAVGLAAGALRGREPAGRALGLIGGFLAGLLLLLWLLPVAAVGAGRSASHLATWVQRVVLNPRLAEDAGILAWAPSNVALLNAARHLRGAGGPDDPLPVGPAGPGEAAGLLLCAAGLLGPALALAVRAGRGGDRILLAAATGQALAAGLLLSPLTWAHQLVQLVPAISFSARALLDRQESRLALAVAAAPVLPVWMAYGVLALPRAGLPSVLLAAWIAASLALLLRRPAD